MLSDLLLRVNSHLSLVICHLSLVVGYL
jgi:hypothetical protein